MTTGSDPALIPRLWARGDALFGGVLLASVIAVAAIFLSEHYGAPAMLFALLIGMAFHFLSDNDRCGAGIDFASRTLLRAGVALLGLQLSVQDVTRVGVGSLAAVVGFVFGIFALGAALSYLGGRRMAFGMLAGGSVAICGASAALAITSVLPPSPDREKDALFVVIGVTTLSTIAMIVYPILFRSIGLGDLDSGFLIGATIHDVAQVVGAGYSISDEAGVVATFVKMVRVALLPVVMLVVMLSFRNAQSQRITLPWFLAVFLGLAILANSGLVPAAVSNTCAVVSRWCLVISISALGVKTSVAAIAKVQPFYAVILLVETVVLLALALGFVMITTA